jgi:CDP-diglyceride synthetase
MSQPAPTDPHPQVVNEVSPPDAPNKTEWTAAAGVFFSFSGMCTSIAGVTIVHEPWRGRFIIAGLVLMALSQACGNIGSWFAKKGGVFAAARALQASRSEQ